LQTKPAYPAVAVQVSARTICMQFEGHSTAVSDIVVDAVGKYAYTISSPHTEELPVIMDVALEERTKVTTVWQAQIDKCCDTTGCLCSFHTAIGLLQVLTVHSNVRIENHTSHALQVGRQTCLDCHQTC
jgi:hypothetical protein